MNRWLVILATFSLAWHPSTVSAQEVEIAPFGGYRLGGGFFERITSQEVDLDGAPAVGGVLNIAMHDGLWFEGYFTHQTATVDVPGSVLAPPKRWRITVDHWMAGGLREFGHGRARPFLTGLLGLTRYAAERDNEIRFAISAGGAPGCGRHATSARASTDGSSPPSPTSTVAQSSAHRSPAGGLSEIFTSVGRWSSVANASLAVMNRQSGSWEMAIVTGGSRDQIGARVQRRQAVRTATRDRTCANPVEERVIRRRQIGWRGELLSVHKLLKMSCLLDIVLLLFWPDFFMSADDALRTILSSRLSASGRSTVETSRTSTVRSSAHL